MRILFTPATVAVQLIILLLVIAAVATIPLGITGRMKPTWYFAAGVLMYIVSFITAFSIGLYVLSITFVLFSLAIVHAVMKVKPSPLSSLTAVGIGLALGMAVLVTWLRFGLLLVLI